MRPRAGLAVIGGTRGVRLAATRSAVVVAVVIGLSSGCATIRRHSTLETTTRMPTEVCRCLYAGTQTQ